MVTEAKVMTRLAISVFLGLAGAPTMAEHLIGGSILWRADSAQIASSQRTLVAEDAPKRVLVPTSDIGSSWTGANEPFDDSGWTHGTPIVPGKAGGVGFEDGSGFEDYISYDLHGEMYTAGRTCAYIRIPFSITDADDINDFNVLTLRVRYDDGYLAYLNGVEVARGNAPISPRWDSAATQLNHDSAAILFENIDISQHASLLRQDENVLAIHGLNATSASSDFLISAELLAGGAVAPGIFYVDDDAPGANDGSSWRDAYNSLQDALADANSAPKPVDIRVAQGVYTPDRSSAVPDGTGDREATFRLINGVTLRGGYAGIAEPDPDARDVAAYATILSGDLNGDDGDVEGAKPRDLAEEPTRAENSYHVLIGSGTHETAVLNGFTITAGNANGPPLGDHPFDPDNYRLQEGGGMCNHGGSPTLSNCTFSGNSAVFCGGGMYNDENSSPTLTNCTFSGNSADWGGGMNNWYSSPTLTNCTFSGNFVYEYGGGMYNDASSPTLTNCTFSENSAWHSGGGMQNSNSFPTLINCIVWGNTASVAAEISGSTSVSYSNIHGGWEGEGNIDTDPLFADADGPDNILGTQDDDLRLSPISPCVDAGDPDYMPQANGTDLAGQPRLRYARVDMGAYEFQGMIYVDDDAPDDPGPDDIIVSDPLENGAEPHPMDSIQEAIDVARDGYTVLVRPGVYNKIDFEGKAITVAGAEGAAVIEVPEQDAVTFHTGEGPDSLLKNFVIRNSGIAISLNYESSPTIRNVTIADNNFGVAAYENSNPDISNCIFWNNKDGDLFQCEARYSCIESGDQGQGNISINPLFVDAANGDYHLRSEGWYWNTEAESWSYDHVTSRCIDAGNPGSPLDGELMAVPRDPNNQWGVNLRINMGAFGGTPQASMPPHDWALLGDLNNDGCVNYVDLAKQGEGWLRSASEQAGDLNRDGVVDAADLGILCEQWLRKLPWPGVVREDITAPVPDPAQWAPNGAPREVYGRGGDFDFWAEMTAAAATDDSGGPVEYFFECTTRPGFSSGWQTDPFYTVRLGRAGQDQRFRVKARDIYGNETAWSEELPVN